MWSTQHITNGVICLLLICHMLHKCRTMRNMLQLFFFLLQMSKCDIKSGKQVRITLDYASVTVCACMCNTCVSVYETESYTHNNSVWLILVFVYFYQIWQFLQFFCFFFVWVKQFALSACDSCNFDNNLRKWGFCLENLVNMPQDINIEINRKVTLTVSYQTQTRPSRIATNY